jgi:hypothetical protein
MTDLSNRDRLASDERFDRRFSGDRKKPVEGDVRTDHDHATEVPHNCGLTSADGDVIDQDRSFPTVLTGARRRWFCGRSMCAISMYAISMFAISMFARRRASCSPGLHGENVRSADAAMFLDLEIQHEQASRRIVRL